MSVRFSGEYVDKKFHKGDIFQKSKVATTVAHGYYLGARRCEEMTNAPWWKRLYLKKCSSEAELSEESVKAANHYIKEKGFGKLNFYEQALIKSTVSFGFREGFTSRATKA
jgi:hypothetical protein